MQLLPQALRHGSLLLVAFSLPVPALCRIYSIRDIAKLTDSSPVIVVGEVLSADRVGPGKILMPDGTPYACESMTAFIQVDEVLKGESASGTIQVDYLHNPDWEGGPLTNELATRAYLMFFLKPDGDRFAFTAPDQSSIPMSRSRSALSDNSAEDVYAQVLRHLAEGLFDEQALSRDRVRSIFVIDTERSPLVPEMYKLALHSSAAGSDRAFRYELLAALVRRKDLSVLPDLETALLTVHDADVANAGANMISALQEVDSSIAGLILVQALNLPEPTMRGAAAAALNQVRSGDAVWALFDSLDDPDVEVRRAVINSLTAIFQKAQCLPPTDDAEDAFRACVEHWKEIAATKKMSLRR
jgi:hypothetical protein